VVVPCGGGHDQRIHKGRGTAVRPLVGRRKSVCSACGCAARGNEELGVDVGVGLWDRWSQRCTDVCAWSVGCAARRTRRHAWARTRGPVPKPFGVTLFKSDSLQIFELKCSKQCIPKLYIS
jgi:hypothetical protein